MMNFGYQIVAARGSDRPETLISCGFQNLGYYSHSLGINTFCIINVFLIPGSDSDSLCYSYSPACTALGYQNVITMITGAESLYRMNGFHIHIIL